ncbi:MAG: LPS-assembly protein LptD, partial [Muribaculaceae bacterium]|nr:LPS-assembly protein LptD [Muribaculaceae bacterium]
ISATFNVFKYINLTPTLTLNDRMYTSKIKRAWDPNASAEVRDTTYSFYNIFDFNFSLSLNTKIYGFFRPMKFLGDKVQMIRHVLTPTITLSAAPDFSSPFWGYWGSYEYLDPNGVMRERRYSYFQHGLFGGANSGRTGMVTFNIANNLEAKVRSDKDSTGYRKISLIENFSLTQSYNFAADSLRWSNLNTSLLLRITKGFNLSLNATWDVYKYALNEFGNPVRVNKLRITHGGGWGRLASTGTSFSYTINNDTFKRKRKDEKKPPTEQNTKRRRNRDGTEEEDQSGTRNGVEFTRDGYAKWDFPWSITANYSFNYGYGAFDYKKLEYKGRWTHNLSLTATVRPTRNWNISASASYDFENHKIAYMNCTISRLMHCFEMSASFVPVGPYKSYNFHIAVKSSILQDVKYDKHSSYSNGVTW